MTNRLNPVEIERYLAHSEKIATQDLDWEVGRQAGLTSEEQFILTYFSDIESQTIIYLRDLLQTTAVEEPETVAFLSMWNYEEYFHGQALAHLLAVCGFPLEESRIARVRKKAGLRERFISWGGRGLSRLFRNEFPSLYMAWGAINEMTTLRGYESLEQKTSNPILKSLCDRIAKQERRHFAWYFNSARERLAPSRKRQIFTRQILTRFWTPVGVGVKTPQEACQLIGYLFPDSYAFAREIDEKIASLPGLDGIKPMQGFLYSRPSFSQSG